MSRFDIDRAAGRKLKATPEMAKFLAGVAAEAEREVARLARSDRVKRSVKSDVALTADGYEARVGAGDDQAFFWHIEEFGSSQRGPRPYLRPGVQITLSRYGGRFRSE